MAVRHILDSAAPAPRRTPPAADLREAGSIDLVSMCLVLRQHLDELRQRGVEDDVLRPFEAELRRYDETVDQLIQTQQR